MPHFTVKDLEKMVTDKLDKRGLKPVSAPTGVIEGLRQAAQRLGYPKLPRLPKV